ncbi:possible serine protease [Rhodobacterales bacterium HTCC2150]|nr:possible serine protease [Rhodobacterales bacterium HTCC2150] [Rhodobacteraceae bacterium HTCC2150]
MQILNVLGILAVPIRPIKYGGLGLKPITLPQSLDTTTAKRSFVALVLGVAFLMAQAISANARPDSFADLAEDVSNSVVNITTSTTVAGAADLRPIVPEGSPLEDFFRDFTERQRDGQRPRRSAALGSGFVISADGYIVTNNHVIDKADEIMIEFFSGLELEAKLVGTDPKTDIALLKVESDVPLEFVEFGNSDVARVGDWVMAVGNPLGQGFSVSAGIISARNRSLSGTYDDFIQTDAAINKGNSGGPLFNMDGDVIGVNTAILSPSGGSIGIGFSMSSSVVTNVVDQLLEFGETRRGWLGVRIQDVTADVAEALGLAKAEGALITDVPDGPAKDAGVLAGDVILTFDGADIVDTRELVRIVGNTQVGKAVDVLVVREGAEVTLAITLGRREEAESVVPASAPATETPPADQEVLGIKLAPLTDELRAELDLGEKATGLVVRDLDEQSEAYEKGLRAGDLIAEAGQKKVVSAADLTKQVEIAIEAGRKSLLLLVRRAGQPRFVALSVQ